jgi:hypothetical protein
MSHAGNGGQRKKASELADKEIMPCIVRELDNDQATMKLSVKIQEAFLVHHNGRGHKTA